MVPRYQLLLVEDNPTDVLLLKEMLAEVTFATFDLLHAEQLSEAMEQLAARRVDIVLLDLNLPDSQGLETLVQLHRHADQVPIVVLTGLEDESLGLRLIQAGAQDYLVKGQFKENLLARAIFYAIERKRAEEALKQADRSKDEFLAMLAHELRNPLAPIRNAVQIMRLIDLPEPRLEWARDIIDRQVQHLTRLVDDLLDVSRITQGKITLHKELLNVTIIMEQAVEISRPLADAHQHRLTIVYPPAPMRVRGDLVRLTQVIANLLNNAAKFTPVGGCISLTAEAIEGEVVLRVKDSGVGIPAEQLPYIFDLFTQGDRSLDRAQGGLGIGLTLVKRLVEMHDGRVDAISPGRGQGSEFVVRLPLLMEAQEVAQRLQPAVAPRWQILVVDDNMDIADSTAMLLKLDGHEVRAALDGPSALQVAQAFQPQVVLLDIGLPGMNGYEVARRLRETHGREGLLLIAMTGYGQAEDHERTRKAGFNHHLVKPVDPEALKTLLASI